MRPVTRGPLVIGHRGHSIGAPEQTMAAFHEADSRGADMIEADVRCTRDGSLVLIHDVTLDRTTTGTGPVRERTYDELRPLDAGSWFSATYAGEHIPLLGELFDLAEESGIALCLEAKGETAAEQVSVATAVATEISVRGRLDTDVLASFDHHTLAVAVSAVPGVRVAPDRFPERGLSVAAEILAQARSCGAHIVQHHHLDLRAPVVESLHAAGVEVWAWPVNIPADIERVLAMGVDGVMSDDVTAAVERIAVAG